jgi:hypothetical protein
MLLYRHITISITLTLSAFYGIAFRRRSRSHSYQHRFSIVFISFRGHMTNMRYAWVFLGSKKFSSDNEAFCLYHARQARRAYINGTVPFLFDMLFSSLFIDTSFAKRGTSEIPPIMRKRASERLFEVMRSLDARSEPAIGYLEDLVGQFDLLETTDRRGTQTQPVGGLDRKRGGSHMKAASSSKGSLRTDRWFP